MAAEGEDGMAQNASSKQQSVWNSEFMSARTIPVVIGMSDTYASCETPDRIHLEAEVAAAALSDARLDMNQVDAIVIAHSACDNERITGTKGLASPTEMKCKVTQNVTFIREFGSISTIARACELISSGDAEYVLCLDTEPRSPGDGIRTVPGSAQRFGEDFGSIIDSFHADAVQQYLHEFGVTEYDLADVAVENQKWGAHHPHARKAGLGLFDREQVMNSPYVAAPLREWMCATGARGASAALLVTASDNVYAQQDPVYVLGYSSTPLTADVGRLNMPRYTFGMSSSTDLPCTSTAEAANSAYFMSGLGPCDIEMTQIATNYAHMGPITLEDLGFADKGRGIDLYRGGHTGVDGDLPTDTNGGWLSFGRPVHSRNMSAVVEAVRQLRGTPLGLAPPGRPRTVLIHETQSYAASNSVLILSTTT